MPMRMVLSSSILRWRPEGMGMSMGPAEMLLPPSSSVRLNLPIGERVLIE